MVILGQHDLERIEKWTKDVTHTWDFRPDIMDLLGYIHDLESELYVRRKQEQPLSHMATIIHDALGIISRHGGFDEAHHKQWVLDQVVRILLSSDTDDLYHEWVRKQKECDACAEKDSDYDCQECEGSGVAYEWSEGIAP